MEWNGVEWSRVEKKRKKKEMKQNKILECRVGSRGKYCSMNYKFLCKLGYNVICVSLCESLTEFETHCLNIIHSWAC